MIEAAVPDARFSLRTPELLADYMRRETKRQGELAALTGIKMNKPK